MWCVVTSNSTSTRCDFENKKLTNLNNWKMFLITDYIKMTITSIMIHLWHFLVECYISNDQNQSYVLAFVEGTNSHNILKTTLNGSVFARKLIPPTQNTFYIIHKMNNCCNSVVVIILPGYDRLALYVRSYLCAYLFSQANFMCPFDLNFCTRVRSFVHSIIFHCWIKNATSFVFWDAYGLSRVFNPTKAHD